MERGASEPALESLWVHSAACPPAHRLDKPRSPLASLQLLAATGLADAAGHSLGSPSPSTQPRLSGGRLETREGRMSNLGDIFACEFPSHSPQPYSSIILVGGHSCAAGQSVCVDLHVDVLGRGLVSSPLVRRPVWSQLVELSACCPPRLERKRRQRQALIHVALLLGATPSATRQ